MAAYLDNQALHQEFVRWRGSDRFPASVPDEITSALQALVDGLGHHPSWHRYTFLSDMKQAALLDFCKWGFQNYDPHRFRNPHAFFTMIAWRAFGRTVKRESRERTADAVSMGEALTDRLAAPAPDDGPPQQSRGPFDDLNARELATLLGLVQGRNTTARTDRRAHLFARLGVTDRGALLILLRQHGADVPLPLEHRPAPSNKRLGKQLRALAAG